jgi:hypothetical protein
MNVLILKFNRIYAMIFDSSCITQFLFNLLLPRLEQLTAKEEQYRGMEKQRIALREKELALAERERGWQTKLQGEGEGEME